MTKDKDDELRQLILARRARFIAAAMCTSGVAIVGCDAGPTVCLSMPYHSDSSTDQLSHSTTGTPEPSVCLSPTYAPASTTDATTDATYTTDAALSAGPDAGLDAGLDAAADASSPTLATESSSVSDGGSLDANVAQSELDATLDASSTVTEP